MNLSTASRTFQLLSRLLDPRSSTEPFVPSAGDKRALPLRPAAQPFPRALPAISANFWRSCRTAPCICRP